MGPAVADAAAASPPLPDSRPALSRSDLAAVKALMFPCLAGLWVGGASAAAAAATLAVHPNAEGPLLIGALIAASLGATLLAALLFNVVFLLLLRAALRDSDSILEACGPSLKRLLRDTACFSCLAALTLDVLSVVWCFVAMELSEGSRVGALFIDVVAVISAAISCFDILPSTAIKLWRMMPGGAAANACIV